MKGTVCWCKVLLMTLIADWNLKGLHTGQMDRIPILWLVGASEQHTGVIEKNEVGAYWLFWNLTVQYQLTVLCSQIMLVYPACQKKRGLHWTKRAESISSGSRHTISSCCNLVRVWSTLRAQCLSTGIQRALQFVLQKGNCTDTQAKAYVM